jgi:hypothetical protein
LLRALSAEANVEAKNEFNDPQEIVIHGAKGFVANAISATVTEQRSRNLKTPSKYFPT